MKKMKLYIYLTLLCGAVASCKKDFLQRLPKTDITEENYFNAPRDLELYTNTLYDRQLRFATDDINSDNISNYSGSGEIDILVRGNITPQTVGGWDDWDQLRRINFMLDNVGRVKGDPAEINHYVGIARFFRAWFYYQKVVRYSDVPWYSHVLSMDDQSLYKGRDSRTLVVDSIMADLKFATENIRVNEKANGTRVSVWSAVALLSRFCLFEGTFRKYHTELNLQSTAGAFLQTAVKAGETLIASGKFRIYTTGKGGADYRALFASSTLSGNPEMIQWADFQQSLGRGNNTHAVLGWTWSLSQSLAYSYLMKDGTPYTSQAGYDKKGFVEMFRDRDPRLAETISYPGFSTTQDNKVYLPKPNLGGYDQLKFYPRDPAQRQGWEANFTGLPVFRYAEVLLNLAEAKAELGTLTDADLQLTVKPIRDRVNMPALSMAANANPDPVLMSQYPEVTGANKGVLLEIRRERRVELACEGRRFEDLNRWKSGNLFQQSQQGMYVPALGGIDMTGDQVADIALLPSPNDTTAIKDLPAPVRERLIRFYLRDKDGKENNFYLQNGNNGHIMFTRDRDNPRVFKTPQYYYRPIPLNEMMLNDKLKQIMGW